MKTTYQYALSALAALAATGGAFAQTGDPEMVKPVPPGWEVPTSRTAVDIALNELRGVTYALPGYDGADFERQIADVEMQLAQAQKSQDDAKRYLAALDKGGTPTATMKRSYEARAVTAERRVKELQKRLQTMKRIAPLQKKVDVKFENATVKQAAEALSKASGVQIKADSDIPAETRLTVQARKVRLVTVLESVARQAGLIIEPINLEGSGNIGATLTAPPMLRVNDKEQRFGSGSSPWSEAWGTPPNGRGLYTPFAYYIRDENKIAELSGLSERIARAEVPGAFPPRVSTFTSPTGTRTRVRFPDGSQGELGYASKAVTVTLTEPGKNDTGESGVYRSVFVLKDGAFVRQSRVWEKGK